MSGKLGRPPEDRVQRKLEIWQAVSPLIEKHGARKLTMRQAAAAAFISLGGLYHYFPNKRALVLFGLDLAPFADRCTDFQARSEQLKEVNPDAVIDEFVRLFTDITFFKRPAIQAALELGTAESRSRLESHVNMQVIEGFMGTLRLAMPDADDNDLRPIGRALRELSFACALDRSMNREEFERELRAVIRGAPVGQHRARLAVAG